MFVPYAPYCPPAPFLLDVHKPFTAMPVLHPYFSCTPYAVNANLLLLLYETEPNHYDDVYVFLRTKFMSELMLYFHLIDRSLFTRMCSK